MYYQLFFSLEKTNSPFGGIRMIRYSLLLFLVTGFFSFETAMTELFEKNAAFQNIFVTGENGKYVITGETRSANGEFFFTVEDGHNEWITGKKKTVSEVYPTWSKFKIEVSVPIEKLPKKNGSVILYLFERSSDGKMLNTLPVELNKKE